MNIDQRADYIKRLAFYVLLTLSVFCFAGYASAADENGAVAHHELDSKLMGRKMPYNVITPVGYDAAGKTYPTLYLLHGLIGKYSDWNEKSKLNEYAQSYQFLIVSPEGANGWYTDSPVKNEDKYETYIIEELIPEVEKNYRATKSRGGRAIAGLSMGGYGALKFGLKYPEKFVLAGSFSGALRAAEFDSSTMPDFKVLGESTENSFGPSGSRTRAENDIFKLVAAVSGPEIKEMPFVYMDCGTEDFLVIQNKEFAGILLKKKIPFEFRQLPGQHDWPYWDKQIQQFLRVAGQIFETDKSVSRNAAGGQ